MYLVRIWQDCLGFAISAQGDRRHTLPAGAPNISTACGAPETKNAPQTVGRGSHGMSLHGARSGGDDAAIGGRTPRGRERMRRLGRGLAKRRSQRPRRLRSPPTLVRRTMTKPIDRHTLLFSVAAGAARPAHGYKKGNLSQNYGSGSPLADRAVSLISREIQLLLSGVT